MRRVSAIFAEQRFHFNFKTDNSFGYNLILSLNSNKLKFLKISKILKKLSVFKYLLFCKQ